MVWKDRAKLEVASSNHGNCVACTKNHASDGGYLENFKKKLFLFIIKILFKSYPLAVKFVPLLIVRITN